MTIFKDKVAIVTGGASGIGREICFELGRRGAIVTVADINEKGAQESSTTISNAGGRAKASVLDVSKYDDVRKLIEETTAEHGKIDYIFNNAAIAIMGEARDRNLEQWHRVIEVNLLGVVHGSTIAYSLMEKQGFGHIVNVASLAGLVPAPLEASYTTAKHGVVGLSTSLRAEGAGLGVKVSVVCPGVVDTNIYSSSDMLKADNDSFKSLIPFKMMKAEKAAKVTLKGVARNRAIIVFPFHARIFWSLYRIFPGIAAPISQKVMKDFRAIRQ